MNEEKIISIPGRLKSVAEGTYVAGTEDIYDDQLMRTQKQINSLSADNERTLKSRMDLYDEHVTYSIDGGDRHIATAEDFDYSTAEHTAKIPTVLSILDWSDENVVKTVDQDLTTAQLQTAKQNLGMITEIVHDITLINESDYADVSAAINAVPSALRIGGISIKFSNSTTGKYETWTLTSDSWSDNTADWQGVDEEPTAGSDNLVKSGGVQNELALGAVYDVSAHNNNATFDSLEALLSDADINTLIPAAVRKGGMSIKFVQTSDNKYVQYRLMTTFFSINVANWQREIDNNSFYEYNNEYSNLTKMFSNAVKSLYLPFIPNNGYKLCVVARNQTSSPTQPKYQFRIYEDNLSGGVIQGKGFQFNSNDYVEPESKYATIQLTSFGYSETLIGYLTLDWSKITDGSYNTSLIADVYKINPTFILSSISPAINDMFNDAITYYTSTIMANVSLVKHNAFYDNRNPDCGLTSNNAYDYTDPVDISEFSDLMIHFTYDTAACCPIWDENNNLIGNISTTGVFDIFDLYPTAKKIAFCWRRANLNDYTVKYADGRSVNDAISNHESRIGALENSVLVPAITWNLPTILNVPSDFDFWYYENSLLSNYDVLFGKAPYSINVVTDCTTKNIRDGFGNIVCNGTYITFSLILNNIDGTKKTISTHTITISQKTKLTNTTKNVIFIGDSYVDNTYGTRGMIGWIDYFATQDGNTLESKGIRTNEYGYHAEAYQGWNESQFLRYVPTSQRAEDAPNTRQPGNVVNSPFMFSQDDTVENAVFNFSKYITDFNIGSVDTIVFFLGMNGGNGNSINRMIFGGDNAIVSSIKDVLPNAKIIICMVPPYWGHDNLSTQVKNTGENNRITQSRSYISLFENKTNISICPVNGYNRIYGYRTNTNTLNMFKFTNGNLAGDATLPKGNSYYDHHPSTNGVQQLAYNIYKMIFAS